MAAKGLCILLYFIMGLLCLQAQVPQAGNKKFTASKEDLPFVRCSVCQKAVKHIRQEVTKMNEMAGAKKLDEDDILNMVEKSCDPDTKNGEWITRYDIIESDGALKLFEQEMFSKCKQECRTVAKACEESIGEIDTDLGELLWKDTLSLSKLINKVCYELTNTCKKKLPRYIRGKRKDEIFTPMTDDEKKAYDVMKQMKSIPGMPGMQMYSKDDISSMQEQILPDTETSKPPPDEIPHNYESTNLGLIDTVKASFYSMIRKIKSILGYGNRNTEL